MNYIDNLLKESKWLSPFSHYLTSKKSNEIASFLKNEYTSHPVTPHPSKVFNAFELTPFDKVKVVFIGNEPYHNQGLSNGLAFGSNTAKTQALNIIFKKLDDNTGAIPSSNSLVGWAKQGVLLLNRNLTAKIGQENSHSDIWLPFTDAVLSTLQKRPQPVIFVTFGEFPKVLDRYKNSHIDFFAEDFPFILINDILTKSYNLEPINWQLTNNLGENEYVRFFRSKNN